MAEFEQSSQKVRTGSRVFYNYPGGDVDLVRVVSVSADSSIVRVKFRDGQIKDVSSAALSPYAKRDFDPADRW